MRKYIGLDMDSKKTVACILDGQKESYVTIPTEVDCLRQFFKYQKKNGCRVYAAFEISGHAGYFYDQLSDCVDELKIVNPTKATWIYRTTKKNDRIDARKIALLYSFGELPCVHMPDKDVRQWRMMILHRQKTVRKVGMVKNKIRALLKSEGFFRAAHGGGWWKKANRDWMYSLCESQSESFWPLQLADQLRELSLFEIQRDNITSRLDRYLDTQPGCRLLMSIPGIGPRTTEAVLAYTDDVERFKNGKQYCAYFGLTPKLDESGSMRRLGHISKQGPSVVRWVLTEACWKVVRYCPSLRAFYERVMSGQSGRKKVAVIAVARKVLSIMRSMLISGEMFNEETVMQSLKAA